MKKAQMEIMGLAIIVILISAAMLFTIRFVVLTEPSTYKKEYMQTELGYNILSTLFKTTVPDCNNRNFEELYRDCAIDPDNPQISCDDWSTSCAYINKATDDILNDTLGKWNIGYEFIAKTKTTPIPIVRLGSCPTVKKHKSYPIPIDSTGENILSVTLDICDKLG